MMESHLWTTTLGMHTLCWLPKRFGPVEFTLEEKEAYQGRTSKTCDLWMSSGLHTRRCRQTKKLKDSLIFSLWSASSWKKDKDEEDEENRTKGIGQRSATRAHKTVRQSGSSG